MLKFSRQQNIFRRSAQNAALQTTTLPTHPSVVSETSSYMNSVSGAAYAITGGPFSQGMAWGSFGAMASRDLLKDTATRGSIAAGGGMVYQYT